LNAKTVLYNRMILRTRLAMFLAKQRAWIVVKEACGKLHFWDRVAHCHSHIVGLVPAANVSPFVKRLMYDRADAEAVSEATMRPTMRFVAVKAVHEGKVAAEVAAGRKAVFPWASSSRFLPLDRSDGLTKWILGPETDRLRGAGIAGPGAGELLAGGRSGGQNGSGRQRNRFDDPSISELVG